MIQTQFVQERKISDPGTLFPQFMHPLCTSMISLKEKQLYTDLDDFENNEISWYTQK